MRATQFDHDSLARGARGDLFGPDKPQLPSDPMLMLDRITHISETGGLHDRGEVIAELDINPRLWFFACHFQGDPVMPGCLGLDAMWQLLGFYLGWLGGTGKGRALGVDKVRFTGQVLPTSRLVRYQIDIRRVIRRKLTMGIADGIMSVDDQPIYTASGLQVGLFHSGPVALVRPERD